MNPYPLDEHEHQDLEAARAMSRVMDDDPTDVLSAEEPALRVSAEDEALQACANAIFHDAEIRAKWGFPARVAGVSERRRQGPL